MGASAASAGQVLSFAAVGIHGRDWWTPASALAGFGAAGRFVSSALMFLLMPAPAASQPAGFQDFAARIAEALPPGATLRLACVDDDGRAQIELARLLSARGIRLTEKPDGATTVRCSCLDNLREHACVAEIGDGTSRRVVVTAQPRDRTAASERDPIVALESRPLYVQRDPMLDVVVAGSQFLVLMPKMVMLVPANLEGATTASSSQSITTSRVWPRDLRGRLRTTTSGFEAFLPGVTCRGSTSPFTLACADEGEPWPIGIENSGMAPNRNTFATPEGLSFYDAASLGDRRWLVIDSKGTLTFLDPQRQVVAKGDVADHAVGLKAPCNGLAYVVTAPRQPDADSAGQVRLSRVSGGTLVAEASTLVLPGVLTALWPTPDERSAIAVVHDAHASRYEALHLSLSCAR